MAESEFSPRCSMRGTLPEECGALDVRSVAAVKKEELAS